MSAAREGISPFKCNVISKRIGEFCSQTNIPDHFGVAGNDESGVHVMVHKISQERRRAKVEEEKSKEAQAT